MDAARDFLGTNRNDLLAADLMTVYAQMRMTNEFRSFGIAYATNSPALLLEFADVYVLVAGFLEWHNVAKYDILSAMKTWLAFWYGIFKNNPTFRLCWGSAPRSR